jgi:hypothetical protein
MMHYRRIVNSRGCHGAHGQDKNKDAHPIPPRFIWLAEAEKRYLANKKPRLSAFRRSATVMGDKNGETIKSVEAPFLNFPAIPGCARKRPPSRGKQLS